MSIRRLDFIVIGAGLAGSEAALTLAEADASVRLYEQKPKRFSAAHRLSGAAELVCSNSFKSMNPHSAHGLLKAELEILNSPLLKLALQSRVPGGQALSVDREIFSQKVTNAIEQHPRIDFVCEAFEDFPSSETPTLIATGPLSSDILMKNIREILGDEGLYFYDATSPVLRLDSLDLKHFFWGERRDLNGEDYLNLPLSREQYMSFRQDVLDAEKMTGHLAEEDLKYFEGCLPIEALAERGVDTLAFSCMKPIGLAHPDFPKPYAVIQFRREKAAGDLLNMVGFQTRMKWPEQERVFRKLPGMENAEFVRLGAMHRNSFINAPLHLSEDLSLKKFPSIFMAGQLTGSEGYTEALSTGHYAARSMMAWKGMPESSAIRSLVRYLIQSDPKHFQPMNFNFGLLPPGEEIPVKMKKRLAKKEKKKRLSERALRDLLKWRDEIYNSMSSNFSGETPSMPNSPKTPIEPAVSTSNVL